MNYYQKQKNSLFKAKKLWVNLITLERASSFQEKFQKFDSELEFNVYLKLRKFYGKEHIRCQYPITLLHKESGYPELKWKVDFAIVDDDNESDKIYQLIEAKGKWIESLNPAKREFKLLLRIMYEHQFDLWQKLIVVSDKKFKVDECVSTVLLKDLTWMRPLRKDK